MATGTNICSPNNPITYYLIKHVFFGIDNCHAIVNNSKFAKLRMGGTWIGCVHRKLQSFAFKSGNARCVDREMDSTYCTCKGGHCVLMHMRPLKLPIESLIMNTEPGLAQNAQGKRTTSVRLEHLDTLERIVRDFGFKDRSHFFQLCTDALLQAHRDGHRLDWPPRFVVRD
jgi:hypothetical protein